MYAVQIGAGKIGRGFLGQLFQESGFHTTFVDVDETLVALMNSHPSYRLDLVHESRQEWQISQYDALHTSQEDAVTDAICKADLLSTAVGAPHLKSIAPLLARGIACRSRENAAPVNILLCENTMYGKAVLHEAIRAALPEDCLDYYAQHVALLNTFAGRMVPTPSGKELEAVPLWLVAEPCTMLYYDADEVVAEMPEIRHATPKPHFEAYLKEKLYVHMMGHSTAAYLGHHRGHEFIWQAIRDPYIRETVETCTIESCRGLIERYHLDPSELAARRADFIYRYHNRILNDGIHRVAHEPIRKLGVNERFLGAARHCLEVEEQADTIALAAAAAMHYHHPEDQESSALKKVLGYGGVEAVLEQVCDLSRNDPLFPLMLRANQRFIHSALVTMS